MRELTNEQWEYIEPYVPQCDSPGHRHLTNARDVFEAVLWVLRTEASWHDLPNRFPPYATCHRRFLCWQRCGALDAMVCALADHLRDYGGLDVRASGVVEECGRLPVVEWKARTVRVFRHPSTRRALGQTPTFVVCPLGRLATKPGDVHRG